MKPDSITVHTLAVKRAARLNAEKERYQSLKSHEASAMLAVCEAYMERHSYAPYYLYRQKNMSDNLENAQQALRGQYCHSNPLLSDFQDPDGEAFDMNTAVEMMIEDYKSFDMGIFLEFLKLYHSEQFSEVAELSKQINAKQISKACLSRPYKFLPRRSFPISWT